MFTAEKRAEFRGEFLTDSFKYEDDVEYLRQICVRGNQYHRALLSSLNTCSVTSSTISPQQHVLRTGTNGRPRLIVNLEQVELLQVQALHWKRWLYIRQ